MARKTAAAWCTPFMRANRSIEHAVNGGFERLGRAIVAHPGRIIAIVAAVNLALAAGIVTRKTNNNLAEIWLPQSGKVAEAKALYDSHWASDREARHLVAFTPAAGSSNKNVLTQGALKQALAFQDVLVNSTMTCDVVREGTRDEAFEGCRSRWSPASAQKKLPSAEGRAAYSYSAAGICKQGPTGCVYPSILDRFGRNATKIDDDVTWTAVMRTPGVADGVGNPTSGKGALQGGTSLMLSFYTARAAGRGDLPLEWEKNVFEPLCKAMRENPTRVVASWDATKYTVACSGENGPSKHTPINKQRPTHPCFFSAFFCECGAPSFSRLWRGFSFPRFALPPCAIPWQGTPASSTRPSRATCCFSLLRSRS